MEAKGEGLSSQKWRSKDEYIDSSLSSLL